MAPNAGVHKNYKQICILFLDAVNINVYILLMNSKELKRWLADQGCTFETKKGGSGHMIVRLGDKVTDLPMHGSGKELGTGLVNAIKKALGLK